jgi:hypothetical protein
MAKLISRRERVEVVAYQLTWTRPDLSGGFAFDCDKYGVVDPAQLQPPGLANYEMCQSGKHDMTGPARNAQWVYYEPAVIECDTCKRPVTLSARPRHMRVRCRLQPQRSTPCPAQRLG